MAKGKKKAVAKKKYKNPTVPAVRTATASPARKVYRYAKENKNALVNVGSGIIGYIGSSWAADKLGFNRYSVKKTDKVTKDDVKPNWFRPLSLVGIGGGAAFFSWKKKGIMANALKYAGVGVAISGVIEAFKLGSENADDRYEKYQEYIKENPALINGLGEVPQEIIYVDENGNRVFPGMTRTEIKNFPSSGVSGLKNDTSQILVA